jgi:hypothetical protein
MAAHASLLLLLALAFAALVCPASAQLGGGVVYAGWGGRLHPIGGRACGRLGGATGQNPFPCGSVPGAVSTANPYPLVVQDPSAPLGTVSIIVAFPEGTGPSTAEDRILFEAHYRSTVPNAPNNFSAPPPPQTFQLMMIPLETCFPATDRPCATSQTNAAFPTSILVAGALPGVMQIRLSHGSRVWYQCVDMAEYNTTTTTGTNATDPCLLVTTPVIPVSTGGSVDGANATTTSGADRFYGHLERTAVISGLAAVVAYMGTL